MRAPPPHPPPQGGREGAVTARPHYARQSDRRPARLALRQDALLGGPGNSGALCEGLVIQVEDFAPDEVLDDLGLESEFDLMGLFQGVGLPFRSQSAPVQMPNMIWLYRRPILDYWAEHDETLGAIVAHVLVHEIGHHFGLSDEDMEAIEAAAG